MARLWVVLPALFFTLFYAGPGILSLARAKTQDERARLASVEAISFVMRPGQTGEFMEKVGKGDPLVMVILAALVSVDLDRDDDILTLKATLHRALLDRLARE